MTFKTSKNFCVASCNSKNRFIHFLIHLSNSTKFYLLFSRSSYTQCRASVSPLSKVTIRIYVWSLESYLLKICGKELNIHYSTTFSLKCSIQTQTGLDFSLCLKKYVLYFPNETAKNSEMYAFEDLHWGFSFQPSIIHTMDI